MKTTGIEDDERPNGWMRGVLIKQITGSLIKVIGIRWKEGDITVNPSTVSLAVRSLLKTVMSTRRNLLPEYTLFEESG